MDFSVFGASLALFKSPLVVEQPVELTLLPVDVYYHHLRVLALVKQFFVLAAVIRHLFNLEWFVAVAYDTLRVLVPLD